MNGRGIQQRGDAAEMRMKMADQWGAGKDAATAKPWSTANISGRRVDLVWGEFPHSRQDNNVYARFAPDHIVGFDGHRICKRIEIVESNYTKESELSGDEVRKACSVKIFFDDRCVYSFGCREAEHALLAAHRKIDDIMGHPLHLWEPDAREKIIGRKVFYARTPAVIVEWFEDQGSVVVEAVDGKTFPVPVWSNGEDRDPDEENRTRVKDDIFSGEFWWFRD